jgi:hypothetical protein
MSKKKIGFSFSCAMLPVLLLDTGRCNGSTRGSHGPFGISALAHRRIAGRASIAFLLAGVSLLIPITVGLSSTAYVACICTVYRVFLIAFARWAFGTGI